MEMVYIPVKAYLQVLFYHPSQLHPYEDKETREKMVQKYAYCFYIVTCNMLQH